MTTLYSATGLGSTLTVECDGDIVHLTAFSPAETRRAWANPKRADLLAALDATANADVKHRADAYRAASEAEAKLVEQYRRADKAEAEAARLKDAFDDRVKSLQAAWDELGDLRAERDALAATVERVREERDRLLATITRIDAVRRDFYEVRGDWADPHGARALKAQMERAILGDPPFMLPTEAGAGITATYRVTGEEYELRLFSNGSWFDSAGDESTPEQLMDPAKWTDHRLLDGAE